MDKDRTSGAANKAKGAVKDAVGSATGDTKTQAEGKMVDCRDRPASRRFRTRPHR